MTNKQRKEKIIGLNNKVMEIITSDNFILNEEVDKLTKQVIELQNKCNHSFIDGYCEYCFKKEE